MWLFCNSRCKLLWLPFKIPLRVIGGSMFLVSIQSPSPFPAGHNTLLQSLISVQTVPQFQSIIIFPRWLTKFSTWSKKQDWWWLAISHDLGHRFRSPSFAHTERYGGNSAKASVGASFVFMPPGLSSLKMTQNKRMIPAYMSDTLLN